MGVHQGSVLSLLLFIIVLEALSRVFREGLPMELLYADDLVLMADELLMEKLRKWKKGMQAKSPAIEIGGSVCVAVNCYTVYIFTSNF